MPFGLCRRLTAEIFLDASPTYDSSLFNYGIRSAQILSISSPRQHGLVAVLEKAGLSCRSLLSFVVYSLIDNNALSQLASRSDSTVSGHFDTRHGQSLLSPEWLSQRRCAMRPGLAIQHVLQ